MGHLDQTFPAWESGTESTGFGVRNPTLDTSLCHFLGLQSWTKSSISLNTSVFFCDTYRLILIILDREEAKVSVLSQRDTET